ncbi:MAG: 50S ribosomal protein L10 [Chloroflexi bacterium]|nr:50S ribosomal protein L10 [Chloroflexota bacterium]
MPITKERKEELVADLAQDLDKVQALIISDYRGLPTAELAKLRNVLRGKKAGLHVVKNTLMELALKRANMPVPEDLLEGPTVVAFCYQDIAGPAQAMNSFLKEKELKVKGAIMGGSVLRGSEAEALATLPSREQLFGRLLGTINAPSSQVVGVVASGIRQVLYLLKARAEQLEKQGAA